MSRTPAVCVLLSVALLGPQVHARKWTDSTGHYEMEAEQIAVSDTTVVLKKRNHELVAVPIAKLSKPDQEHLKAEQAVLPVRSATDHMQTWTMRSGLKVLGTVVDYARKDITLQRRRGKIYVNERRLENLPEIYRRMVPKMVAHFDNAPIDSEAGLETWIGRLQGQPRTYRLEGVLLELPGGDEYGIPFFFLSDDDLAVLKPGWKRWLAAVTQREQQKQGQEAFLLQAQAQAYQQDRSAKQLIAELHLDMDAYLAGQFELWEVLLFPGTDVSGPSVSTVVPAIDSRAAGKEARRRYPGYELGPISKVSRRY